MAKIRVHELAKEREMSPRDMLAKLQAAGLPVKAVASAVDKQQAEDALAGKKVKPKENGSGGATTSKTQRLGGTSDSPRPLGTGDGPRPVRQTRQAEQARAEQQQRQTGGPGGQRPGGTGQRPGG